MGGYHVDPFKVYQGVAQVNLLSPTLFNVVEDTVVRHWLTIMIEKDMGPEGFEKEVQRMELFFYTDDGIFMLK